MRIDEFSATGSGDDLDTTEITRFLLYGFDTTVRVIVPDYGERIIAAVLVGNPSMSTARTVNPPTAIPVSESPIPSIVQAIRAC
jgi:hypothetical protein